MAHRAHLALAAVGIVFFASLGVLAHRALERQFGEANQVGFSPKSGSQITLSEHGGQLQQYSEGKHSRTEVVNEKGAVRDHIASPPLSHDPSRHVEKKNMLPMSPSENVTFTQASAVQ